MRGFSLVEVLIATLITMATMAAVLAVVTPAVRTFDTELEVADMQQRLRVSLAMLQGELGMAGAGAPVSAGPVPLNAFIAPVMPYRSGATNPDLPGTFRSDVVTLIYLPSRPAQTRVVRILSDSGVDAVIETDYACGGARSDSGCGFVEGMRVLIFERDGSWDVGLVRYVGGDRLHVEHDGALSSAYDGNEAVVAQLATHAFYLKTDRAAGTYQLMPYDGIQTDVPAVDHVVNLGFQYFSEDGMELGAAVLTDGPWLPTHIHPRRFDRDLLRIRRIRATVRVQAAAASLRGPDPRLFANPGTASPSRAVADRELTFEVWPRNLSIER